MTAMRTVLALFDELGPRLSDANIVAVGHRVVMGGEHFADAVLIDAEVLATIDRLAPLAPLHNPANLAGISVARDLLPDIPHIAVFDTAFSTTCRWPPPPTRSIDGLPRNTPCVVTERTVRRTSTCRARPLLCLVVTSASSARSSCTSATVHRPRRCCTALPWTPRWGSRRSKASSWGRAPATSTLPWSSTSRATPA